MPEAKSTSKKPATKKSTNASAKPKDKTTKVTVKTASESAKSKTTSGKNASKSASAKATSKSGANSKSSPKLADVKPAKKSTGAKTNSSKSTSTKSKSATAKKPTAQKSTTNKPTTKKSGKAIDSFTIPTDRSKTTAGNTEMDWDDLEKRVEDYDVDEFTPDEPKKSAKSPRADAKKSKNTKATSKPRKVFQIIGIILSLTLLVSSAVLGAMVVAINLLPNTYLLPALAVLGLIAIIFSVLMIHRKVKPAIKSPFFLLSLVFSAIYIFGITYLDKTFDFFDSLKGQDYLTESYYVVVEKDSDYQEIHDLRGKTIATYDEGQDIYQEALKKLQALVKVELKAVDSIGALATSLSNHETDAVLISAVHQETLDDLSEDGSNRFSETTRILYTIEVRVDTEEILSSNINISTEPFTIFISGIDAYGDMSNMQRGRSDVNMLATVNPITHEVLLTSIPRDYYVQLHGTTGYRDKLTHAGIYGVQMSMDTLEDLLDIEIDYYLKVNFSTVESLVDTIGGIEVYSDQQITPLHGGGVTIPKGTVHMDGKLALAFARERYGYATGDRHRVQNQQDVISAIIKKVSGSTVILTKYAEILDNLANCLTTNIGKNEISSLVKMQLQSMPSWQIGQYSLNGSDSHNYTYSMGQQVLYVMEPNLETVKTAHDNIMGIIEGKPLSQLTLTEK